MSKYPKMPEYGKKGIPGHWYESFDNTIHSYLIGKRRFSISGILRRFEKQAKRIHSQQSD